MDKDSRNVVSKRDLLIVVFVLIIAVTFLLLRTFSNNNTDGNVAVLSIDGKYVEKYNLSDFADENVTEISLKEKYNVDIIISLEKGTIRFKNSDCPDHICINSGILKREGDSAACLPNKTVLQIFSYKDAKNLKLSQ